MARAGQQSSGKARAIALIEPANVDADWPDTAPSISGVPKPLCKQTAKLVRLRKALTVMAELVLRNPSYIPIFVRLEEEIAIEEAKSANDVLERARAIKLQNTPRDNAA